ncbi:MAG: RNA polymerase sigma factor, partial [Candidatus Kapabacteria bacterium]|nr:RNA polymerase sigma factor [Candidatus Kapabacteria bacterium]
MKQTGNIFVSRIETGVSGIFNQSASRRMRQHATYSDEELFTMLGMAEERNAAFTELYRRYEKRVWSYARISLQNDQRAKDATQDTFLRILKTGEKGATSVEHFAAYIMRIVRNIVINDQQRKRHDTVDIDTVEIPSAAAATYEQQEINTILETAMQLLPDDYRDAFSMQTYGGMSYQDIADTQQVPLSTVRNRVVRAKAKLRE